MVNPKWGPRIKSFGISPCNRANWLIFNYNNSEFGICSLYVDNDYIQRANFWSCLTLLPDIPWMFGGDFNMIEAHEDKLGGLPFSWKEQEKLFWNMFKQSKCFIDL